MTLFVMDNLTHSKQKKLFSMLGTEYVVTGMAWLNLPIMIIVGIIVVFVSSIGTSLVEQISTVVVYGLLVIVASLVHGIGHIISSRLVGAPVKRVIITSTVNITDYGDESDAVTKAQHIGRAISGPVANLTIAAVMFTLTALIFPSHFFIFFGSVNILFGVFTLMPIPSLDGAVILRELRTQ